MAPQYKLTYFNARALAEPMRLMFALKGVEYDDIRIEKEEWPAKKQDSQFPWGSLPVLQDGGKVLAQSGSIQRYLAKKLDLAGSDDFEAAKCDEMIEAMTDVRQAVFKMIKETDEARKAEFMNTLKTETFPAYLKKFDAILQANGGFFVGKKISYADLNIASYLQMFSEKFPELLECYPNLKTHQDTVFNLDGIKQWVTKRPVTEF